MKKNIRKNNKEKTIEVIVVAILAIAMITLLWVGGMFSPKGVIFLKVCKEWVLMLLPYMVVTLVGFIAVVNVVYYCNKSKAPKKARKQF